jgi:hypothetical protein
MAGALMPMIVCMMLSMLRTTLRIDWEGEGRGEGVRVEHGCLDKDSSTFGDQSPAQTANAPRSRSEFEAWRGGVASQLLNERTLNPHSRTLGANPAAAVQGARAHSSQTGQAQQAAQPPLWAL